MIVESDLINAEPAKKEDLPATVHLADGCTAAKIAPKMLLTAAHCVLDLGTLDPKYGANKPIKLGDSKQHEVARVHVHPRWMSVCADTLCSIAAVTLKIDAPDVAIVELKEDLADVSIAPVDEQPLKPGDDVILVGFGCTNGVHVADRSTSGKLTTKEAKIIAPEKAIHEGSPLVENNLAVYSGNYALTAGPARNEGAGLCPGDSGGPLYRRIKDKLYVAGVNANYTLRPDDQDGVGLPITNWHTRLDKDSRNRVGAWIGATATAASSK